ncbi:hypothetical protein BaRGS_00006104, partial [Batillaria attramentaria]
SGIKDNPHGHADAQDTAGPLFLAWAKGQAMGEDQRPRLKTRTVKAKNSTLGSGQYKGARDLPIVIEKNRDVTTLVTMGKVVGHVANVTCVT